MTDTLGYTCHRCDQIHEELPRSYRADAPVYWTADHDADESSELTPDQCVIRGEQYYIQGNIEIPIVGTDETFSWGVWVSQSQVNFARTCELWETPGRENEPAYFGWLSTELPYEPSTVNLKTNVHTSPVGLRPVIELEPTDHPLAIEQREGITWSRVREIAEMMLHQG